MAFPLDESASSKAEKRVLFGIPGEGNTVPTPASSDAQPVTATEPATELPTTVKPEEGKDSGNQEGDQPGGAILIGDEDEKEDNDQRIVFIERLMGLHLTAPTNGQKGEEANADGMPQDPKNKVNAKWASRTRKFSIPLPSEAQPNQAIPQEQPHPMLRYAAAAMMSRLIAAAARAQMEAQAREAIMARSNGGAKDKDDEAEDESVPVLLATLRDEQQQAMRARQSPPMYGRPMPRPMMRPQPPTMQQRQAMASMAQRLMASPSQQGPSARASAPSSETPHPMLAAIQQLQALQAIQHLQSMQRKGRAQSPISGSASAGSPRESAGQQSLAMVVIPIQSQESRQLASHMSPYANQQYATQAAYARPSYYPSPYGASPYAAASPYGAAVSPYSAYGYRQMAHPHPAASYAVPVHMPMPMHYPAHAPSPYSAYGARPYGGHHYAHPQAGHIHPAYSHMRNIIEVPVEVPVPVHVPVPVAVRDPRQQHISMASMASMAQALQARGVGDSDQSSSDQDHIVLLYDAEVQDQDEGEDLQQSASDAHEKMAYGPKGHPFLNQQLPSHMSANKLKLWRELIGAKHAAQPGVRYMPVAMAQQEESQPQSHHGHFSHQAGSGQLQGQETQQQQPAFIVLSDDQEQPQVRRRR